MPEETRRRLASNLRKLRLDLGLTQEQFAAMCGFKRTYIGTIERAEVDIGIDNLARIAHRLGLKPADLLGRLPEMSLRTRRRRKQFPPRSQVL